MKDVNPLMAAGEYSCSFITCAIKPYTFQPNLRKARLITDETIHAVNSRQT